LEPFCFFIGCVAVWLSKGCKYSLNEKLNSYELGGSQREVMIGWTIFVALGILTLFVVYFYRAAHS